MDLWQPAAGSDLNDQDQNAARQVGDATTSRGSAGGRSQGSGKCAAIADANAKQANAEEGRACLVLLTILYAFR